MAVVLVVMAAIGAGGAVAAGLIGGRKPEFRIAEVTRGQVSEQVELTGKVTRVNQAAATFPTAGRVTWVGVEIGTKVRRGQRLARIDRLPLQVALIQAQAELTQSRVTYRKDLKAAEDAAKQKETKPDDPPPAGAPPGGPGPGGPGSGGSGPGGSGPGGQPAPPSPTVVKLNQLLAALPAQLQAAQSACLPVISAEPTIGPSQPPTSPPDSTATPSQTPSPSSTAAPTPTLSPSGSPSQTGTTPSTTPRPSSPSGSPSAGATPKPLTRAAIRACQARLSLVLETETKAGQLLQQALAELSQATAQLAALAEANAQAAAGGSGAPPPGSSDSGSSGSGAPSSDSDTAGMLAAAASGKGSSGESVGALRVQLAQDLVALTKAQQAVDKARRDLAGATMKAPISGVVGQLDFAVGERATTADQVVIVGKGASRVSVQVPLALMGKVSVGQAADVIPPGMTKPLPGKVTTISPIPAPNSGGSPTYPTVIRVAKSPLALTSGVSATVRIEVAQASNALVVPMSATVPVNERQATVRVLSPSGTFDEVKVKTGVRGISRIEVTSGLQAGDQVILADPSKPLPKISLFDDGG